MNLLNYCIKEYEGRLYSIADYDLYILGIKTKVKFNSEFEPVLINGFKISDEISMRFKYVLGSLNTMFTLILQKELDNEKQRLLLIKIINLMLKFITIPNEKADVSEIESILISVEKEKFLIRDQMDL